MSSQQLAQEEQRRQIQCDIVLLCIVASPTWFVCFFSPQEINKVKKIETSS